MYIPGKQFHDCGKFIGDGVRLGKDSTWAGDAYCATFQTPTVQVDANEIDTGVINPF